MNGRVLIVAIAALVVGVAGGAIGVSQMLGEKLDSARTKASAASLERDNLQGKMAELEQVNGMLEKRVAELQEQLSTLPTQAPEPAEISNEIPEAFAEAGFDAEMEMSSPDGPPPPPDASDSGPGGPPRPGRGESDEERAQRRQAWDAVRNQYETQRQEMLDAAMQNAPDQAARDRIAAIEEYEAYLMELRESMRDAETDEERQALRDAMMENWQTLNDLQNEQQDAMLRDLAAKNGISDPKQQEAFVENYKQLEANPLFRGGRRGPGMWRGRGPGQ